MIKTAALIKNKKIENMIVVDTDSNFDFRSLGYEILDQDASIGWEHNDSVNRFVPPKPFPSWILNKSFNWEAPTPYPEDGKIYVWSEDSLSWQEIKNV